MIIDHLRHVTQTRHDAVEAWMAAQRAKARPFVTTSVDLRHAGERLVPVDTNLYPAGFQNLSVNASRRAAQQLRDYLGSMRRVLIVPETHTRNAPYLENLAQLQEIVRAAGAQVQIGSLVAPAGEPVEIETPSGIRLIQHPLRREAHQIMTEAGFVPDLVLLNNDCSAGVPAMLEGITQPVEPPVSMGWYRRLKSRHFAAYCALARSFAEEFGLDPWTICADFTAVSGVNFKTREGVDGLAHAVDAMLARAQKKHAEYGITTPAYVYVKADSGTYGMGIMVVSSGAELLEMNKKERNKMHVIKEGMEVRNVIVQEGIPTVDTLEGKPAEPMMYLIDGVPVGGMYRVNGQRDAYGNLNAAGMEFRGMCDEDERTTPQHAPLKACDFRVYGVVAAIAALAAARECCTAA